MKIILSLEANALYTFDKVLYIAYIGTRKNENIYEFGDTDDIYNLITEKQDRYKVFRLIHTIECTDDGIKPFFQSYLEKHKQYRSLSEVSGFVTGDIRSMIKAMNMCRDILMSKSNNQNKKVPLDHITDTSSQCDNHIIDIAPECNDNTAEENMEEEDDMMYHKGFIDIINKSDNFDQFCNSLSVLDSDTKGYYFELFTQLFFKCDDRYSHYVEECWLLDELPEKIREELGIPRKDNGIDLIIKTYSDEYWAVQAKYRCKINVSLSWKNLSTFCGLSFGISKGFTKGIIFTNTMYPSAVTENRENILNILYYSLKDTSPDTFERIRTFVNNQLLPIKQGLTPHPYQQEIIDKAREYYKTMSAGRLYMACGTGKTFVSHCIATNLEHNSKICIVAPSLQLVSQIYKTWSRQSYKCKYLLVGSSAEVKSNPHTGLLLTTTSDEIYGYLNKHKQSNIVIISTYQSSDVLASVCKKHNITIDFCIFDEAHRTVGSKDRAYSCLLDNENTQINKRLFITATEKTYIGSNESILSMDDEKVYGKIIHNYSLKQAIADGHLTDYQIIAPLITDKSFWETIKANGYVMDKSIKGDVIESRYYMTAYVLAISMRDKNISHVLTFNNTNENANKFSNILKKMLDMLKIDCQCYVLSGTSSITQREYVMNDFKKDKRAVISSSRIFSEGIDIPIVDCACLVDNKISVNDIIQTCGRPVRKYPGKDMSYIIVPTVVDIDYETGDIKQDNVYNTDKVDPFGLIKNVLKSLATVDDRLIDHFTVKTNSGAQNGYKRRFIMDVENIELHSDVKLNVDLMKEKVKTILCDKWGDLNWAFNRDLLFEYCDIYHNVPKPDVSYKGRNIGTWLNSNKTNISSANDDLYKKLSVNQIVKDSIDKLLKKRNRPDPLNVDTTNDNTVNDISLEDQLKQIRTNTEVNIGSIARHKAKRKIRHKIRYKTKRKHISIQT